MDRGLLRRLPHLTSDGEPVSQRSSGVPVSPPDHRRASRSSSPPRWVNPWLGLLVFLGLCGAAVWLYFRRASRAAAARADRAPRRGRAARARGRERDGRRRRAHARDRRDMALEGRSSVPRRVPGAELAPAHVGSDEDPARAAAQARLDATLAHLSSVGIEARGEVGDVDPLVAVEDAVRTFHPDELIVSTHPEGRSNWLERGVVDALRQRYDVPARGTSSWISSAIRRRPTGRRRMRRTRTRPGSAPGRASP